jgi:hypothetical protein
VGRDPPSPIPRPLPQPSGSLVLGVLSVGLGRQVLLGLLTVVMRGTGSHDARGAEGGHMATYDGMRGEVRCFLCSFITYIFNAVYDVLRY